MAQAFAWAEWALPNLFPESGAESALVYQGIRYTVHSYSNGNVLGFTEDGGIYGYGPYTNWQVKSLGMLRDYAAQIVADTCRMQGPACALPNITAQPLNYHPDSYFEPYFELAYQSPSATTVQWQYSGDGGRRFEDIQGGTATRLVPPRGLDGYYRARLTNASGSVLTRVARLIVRGAQSAADLFPVAPGSQWIYANSRNSVPTVVKVVGDRIVEGRQATAIETQDGVDGSVSTEYFTVDTDGVRDYLDPADQTSPELRLLNGQRIFSFPLGSFTQFRTTIPAGMDVDEDGIEDSLEIVADVSPMVGLELVKTPAGIFASPHRIQQTLYEVLVLSSGDRIDSFLTLFSTTWWVPGVGAVKHSYRARGIGIDEGYDETLQSYVTGDMSNDVTLPLLRFEDPVAFEDEGGILSSAIADLDGDGALDLVYESIGYRYGKPGLYVIWGHSDGRVVPVNLSGLGPCSTGHVATADFDGDGRIELAVANGGCGVLVLQWNAKREATIRQVLQTGGVPWHLWAVDADGRGRPALLVSDNSDQLSSVKVWRADSSGRMQPGELLDFGGGRRVLEVAAADLDGNGQNDLVATLDDYLGAHGLSVLLRRSSGGYNPPIHLYSAGQERPLAVGDLDGDGRPEIVATGQNGHVNIHKVQADGTVSTSAWKWGTPTGLRIADIDGDGRLDLVMALDGQADSIQIRYQQADGTLSAPDPVYNEGRASYSGTLVVGDLNGDGRLDIVSAGARLTQRSKPVTAPMSLLHDQGSLTWADQGSLHWSALPGLQQQALAKRQLALRALRSTTNQRR
ncbi:FG-GAP repeat domain-containing protein [Aquabacterium sp.]|uniref:FG-GAP repeat domain-containing protein n=1 Tax=Aquabacterium sp. TaxID=1872578 RepID=UPI00378379BF